MAHALVNVGPGGVMEAGLASARHKESVDFWHDGENVSFRNLGVEKGFGPGVDLFSVGSPVVRLAQAFSGSARLYCQDEIGRVYGRIGALAPFYIGQMDAAAQLQPYGSWLVCAQAGLKVWKDAGALIPLGDSPAGINHLTLHSEIILGADDETLHWHDVRNLEDWTPTRQNTARNIPFRNLKSAIKAVTQIGNSVAVYTADELRLVNYIGAPFWFGEAKQRLNGIGAIGPNSVINAGFKNYGLSRNGLFVTDGVGFQYIDIPAMHGYLEAVLDWARSDEVFGFHREDNQEVVWFFPSVGEVWLGLGFKYTNNGFTKYRLPIRAAAERDAFPYPLFGTSSGVAYGSDRATDASFITTKPLDGGDSLIYKFWDGVRFVGEWTTGSGVRLGVSDEVNEEPTWVYEGALESWHPITESSVYLTIQLYSDAEGQFSVSQIMVTGEPDGEAT